MISAPRNELLDRPLALRATAMGKEDIAGFSLETTPREVESCSSTELHVVQYKIRFTSYVVPEWYKDEGGKENCIEARVHIVDKTGAKVKLSYALPLAVSAHYESTQREATSLTKESIAVLLPMENGSQAEIDQSTGEGYLRVRFNEVSSKHGQQDFSICCLPFAEAADDRLRHIGCGYSTGVKVKSKRHVARRKQALAQAQADAELAAQTPWQAMGGGNAAEEAALAVTSAPGEVAAATRGSSISRRMGAGVGAGVSAGVNAGGTAR